MKDDKKFKEKFAKAAAKHLWKDSKYPLEVKMNDNIIEKIENGKYDKDKKWLYNFARYILKNKEDLSYHKLQNRINVCFAQSQGYFKDYYRDNKEYRERTINNAKKRMSTEKVLDKQRELMRKQRIIFKLFIEGKLSTKSNNHIEETLGDGGKK